ncbi:MAG: hypothetical protein RQ839_09390 [Thermoproteus sp.]|jgi:hypothetical protein|nr:hypothetical protein [Thermoproteus sp.]MDT7882663.1 hypothetical protein [Thermoproteus sp.]
MTRIDTAKWRGALIRSAIVVLVFALLLEITFMYINIKANNLSQPGLASVLLNKSDAYALVIESIPNVKYRVDVTLQVIRGSALVILNNGSKVLIAASFIPPPPIELTLTRGLRYIGLFPRCFGSYTWLNVNGSLFNPGSFPVSIPGNSTFKAVAVPFATSIDRPVNATLVDLGSLSTSTLSNATHTLNVLNVTVCDDAVSLTPALIVVGLSDGTIVSLSWSYRVVVA